MNINIVNNYIKYLENDKNAFLLYHCNRVEKILPDGSTTKISDFKFNSNKEEIVTKRILLQKLLHLLKNLMVKSSLKLNQ